MKKVVTFQFILLIAIFLFAMIPTVRVEASSPVKTVSSTKNHLLANVNEVIDLSQIKAQGAFGEVFLNATNLSSSNPAVSIQGSSLTVNIAGIFPIQFAYQGSQFLLYVIIKDVEDDTYLIYEQDFTGLPNGPLPQGFQLVQGSAAIQNERLMLDSTSIVLFPSYLQSFTNYIIEVDMNIQTVPEPSRWASVMFRYSPENYFQMAIRQGATAANGVEFAKRINGNWNVPATSSYKENLASNETYALKIDVNETTIKEYIDNELLITYDGAYEFTHGLIGVQSNGNGTRVYFDNIRITMPKSYVEVERHAFSPVVNVYQPQTGIVSPATSLVWFESMSQATKLTGSVRPSTSIFRINEDLNVINKAGDILMSAEEALLLVDGLVIPAFYTNDVMVASKLGELLRTLRIFDVFLISNQKDAILAARAEHGLIRGVLNFDLPFARQLSKEDLMNIRIETNRAQAVASILPIHLLNRELVEYMQKRVMTVWVTASDSVEEQYSAILSGANGIVTQDFEALYQKYSTFGPNTHVRRPLTIAHRGLYNGPFSSAPENTIEVAWESYLRGADIIEFDVHLTQDLEVVVIHDGTTIRTAPDYPSLTVAQSRLDQLQALHLRDNVGGLTNITIPTLREFMETFKGLDVVLFIEPKPTQPLLMQFIMETIEELDMYDQSAIIAFSAGNIQTMNNIYPEMSNGFLTGAILNAQNDNATLTNMFANLVPINATLNPSFGNLTNTFTDAIMHRGVTLWPWTVNDFSSLTRIYNYGVGGITTDYFSYLDETFNRLTYPNLKYQYTLGRTTSLQIRGQIETQTGQTYPYMSQPIVVDDGGTNVVFNQNGQVSSVNSRGRALMYTTFQSTMPNGTPFTITSDLITLDVQLPRAITFVRNVVTIDKGTSFNPAANVVVNQTDYPGIIVYYSNYHDVNRPGYYTITVAAIHNNETMLSHYTLNVKGHKYNVRLNFDS